jgi:hypothetical protein
MGSYQKRHDLDSLLAGLNRLHSLWLCKTESAEDKERAWLSGVVFGIEMGRSRIIEEAAKRNPNIRAVLTDWINQPVCQEIGPGWEGVAGVDYGIRLVIECVCRVLRLAPPEAPHMTPV